METSLPAQTPASPTPEHALLACLQALWNPAAKERLPALLAPGTDWDTFAHLAHAQRVAPAVYYVLREASVTSVTPQVMASLHRTYLGAASQSLFYQTALRQILGRLRQAQVPVLILKGPILAEMVYPDPTLRPMMDVDIVVPPDQGPLARQALLDLGYQVYVEPGDPPAGYQEVILGELTLVRESETWPVIDLHMDLMVRERHRRALRLDVREFWERAQPAHLLGEPVYVLDPADTLLHLCLHWSFGHQFAKLQVAVDLALLLHQRSSALDWETLARRAEGCRVGKAVAQSLRLLRTLWAVPVPHSILHRWPLSPWSQRLLRPLVTPEVMVRTAGRRQDPRRHLVLAALLDSPIALAGILLNTLFPGPRWIALRYGLDSRSAVALWTIWHPLRMIWVAGTILWQRLAADD